jgi:hypothetical protein
MTTSNDLVKNVEIDWEALDEFWVEQYEKDYGHLFQFFLRAHRHTNLLILHEVV